MRPPQKTPALALLSIAALLAVALVAAGCGGGSSSGGGGEPASLAPKNSVVYIEANLAPESSVSDDIDELTSKVFGIEDLGDFVAEELEKAASEDNEKVNFEEEVEPWLGENAGLFLKEVHGDNFTTGGIALETANPDEAEAFIEKFAENGPEKAEEGEFEGNHYWISAEDQSALGVIGDFLVYAETKGSFEAMVEASEGEGLSESEKFKTAMEAAPEGGIGSVYVDLGGIIESSGEISGEDEAALSLFQIEPKKSTLVGTLFPHAESAELDISTDLGKTVASGGDASKQLEALPSTAVAGFATAEFGKSFGEGLHGLSEAGIPGQLEPGEFEGALEQIGINVEALSESLGGAAAFVEGSSSADLGGAAVIESKNPTEAHNTISNLGLLLRATGVEGVSAAGGGLTGFSVHSEKLGSQPLVVGSSGDKIVIAYGPKAAARALKSSSKTLGTTADFEAAKGALGSTPMSAFIDGGPGLKLVEGLLSPEELTKFERARPYVEKISYVGVGSESKGQTTTAKLIVGLSK